MSKVKKWMLLLCASVSLLTYVTPLSAQGTCEGAELLEPGKLIVAHTGEMPMTTIKGGNLTGMDGDIVTRIAERLGLEVQPELMDWSATIESLKARRVDMIVAAMAWTKARTEVVALSEPVYYYGALMTQRKGEPPLKLEQLADKTIGTIQGFSFTPELKAINPKLKLYDTSEAAIRDLIVGRVDVIFLDPVLAQYAESQNPNLEFSSTSVDEAFDENYPSMTSKYNSVIGLSKEAPKLEACVNEAIREMWESCETRTILESYGFDGDYWTTPPTVNLREGVDRDTNWAFPQLGTCD